MWDGARLLEEVDEEWAFPRRGWRFGLLRFCIVEGGGVFVLVGSELLDRVPKVVCFQRAVAI